MGIILEILKICIVMLILYPIFKLVEMRKNPSPTTENLENAVHFKVKGPILKDKSFWISFSCTLIIYYLVAFFLVLPWAREGFAFAMILFSGIYLILGASLFIILIILKKKVIALGILFSVLLALPISFGILYLIVLLSSLQGR